MYDDFVKGYDFFLSNFALSEEINNGFSNGLNDISDRSKYLNNVASEIKKFEDHINSFKDYKTDVSYLKGDVAEFWHADTYNINATKNESLIRMNVDRSHDLGSVDISGSDGQKVSLKYYYDGEASAKAQAKSLIEKFYEFKSKNNNITLEEYLKKNNIDDKEMLNVSLYFGQKKLIPSEQLKDAIAWYDKKIANLRANRPELAYRYEEAKNSLIGRIQTNDGVTSDDLSIKDSERIARLAKKGQFKASVFGVNAPELLDMEKMIKDSIKAGADAAVISTVLKISPEIFKCIDYLIKNGEIPEESFKSIGFKCLSTSSESFIKGCISSAITFSCHSGLLGDKFLNINSPIISVSTVLAFNIIKDTIDIFLGKSSQFELIDNLINGFVIATSGYISGMAFQTLIPIPIFGYMIGNLVGVFVSQFVYSKCKNIILSFCVDSGFTLFGLVDQDYQLSKETLKYIGLDTFDYETFNLEKMSIDTFKFDTFTVDNMQLDSLDIKFLRRGVFSVNKIGYIN